MEKPHHHGNLRAALIDAGLALLETEGVDGLTLRKAAARAGVSHAAPAHHFAGKQGLIVAIAAHGFRTFTALMEAERFRTGTAAEDQLRGICAGYLRFAQEHAALFKLIFATDIRTEPDPELQEASMKAFALLVEVCDLFEPSPGGEVTNAILVWSMVHGYATLHNFSKLSDPKTGARIPFDALLASVRLVPRSGGAARNTPSG